MCCGAVLFIYELVHFGFVVSSTGWICVFPCPCLERFLFDSMCIQWYVFFYRVFVLLINMNVNINIYNMSNGFCTLNLMYTGM